jgi:large subunit ribosomal protein L20
MPRSANAVASKKRKMKVLKRTKGYFGRGKSLISVAKNRNEKGLGYAYRDRKAKKRLFRGLWIQRINAGCRINGISYSVFIDKLKKNNIDLNRKALADLAMNNPEAFTAIVNQVK